MISSMPTASKASICHASTGLSATGSRHLGVLSVNGSNRRPCPALRMMALAGRAIMLFVINGPILDGKAADVS